MGARPDPAPAPPGDAEFRALLSHLSHELSRRLTTLRAGFDLLLNDNARPVAPEQRGHLNTMVTVCDDLLGLTRSYLDYAGLMSGARPLHYGSFTLGALIREVDREFARAAAARRIAWECTLEDADAVVETDASRCQQIFGNLVTNALKYTPEGGRVRVSARREGVWWALSVADSGPGIPEEWAARIFEPFFRLPRDERSGVEGNGLGLSICREMVEQMGGTIAITSTAGADRGTCVTVRLPVAAPRARAAAPARRKA